MTKYEITELLNLEMERAAKEGEISRLREEVAALNNAIWRRTQFCKDLAESFAKKSA